MESMRTILRDLNEEHLQRWAGAAILLRGRAYVKKVRQISRTATDDLAAWVSGHKPYATAVRLGPGGKFSSSCTCPYAGGTCKHAVALVLAARERIEKKKDVPLLPKKDKLRQALRPLAASIDYPQKAACAHPAGEQAITRESIRPAGEIEIISWDSFRKPAAPHRDTPGCPHETTKLVIWD